jgi:hypothetical protein
VARAQPGEVPRVGAHRPWLAVVTWLGTRWREVAWSREVLGDGGWAALVVSPSFSSVWICSVSVGKEEEKLDNFL